jgi:hypothetical protein
MITYSLRVGEGNEDISEHLSNMSTYFLRVGESEEFSETRGTSKTWPRTNWKRGDQWDNWYLKNMIMYILRVGEGKEDISETKGTSKTWPRTFWCLAKATRTSARWQEPPKHDHLLSEGWRRRGGHQPDKGHLSNMVTDFLRWWH